MNKDLIKRGIEKIGANVVFTNLSPFRRGELDFDIDVVSDKKGSFFSFGVIDESIFDGFTVLDINPKDRHLLLMKKRPVLSRDGKNVVDVLKDRLLLGHDERDWFCAAVPGNVSTVQQAKDSLRPDVATKSIKKRGKLKNRNKRRNKGFIRQGEWFFIPVDLDIDDSIIHTNEPIVRQGGGKPHIVEEIVRSGGKSVYVNGDRKITTIEYDKLPTSSKFMWSQRVEDAKVYGRGAVRHPDHKTIMLNKWHEIVPNTEDKTTIRSNLSFLD